MSNGDLETHSDKSAFDMCWHIIRTFIIVDKAWITLRNQLIYKGLKISPYCRVSVFVDAQSRGGVL